MDELFTYVKYKDNRICIAYSYEPKTGYVLDISVGRRNKMNLKKVTDTLVLSEAKTIYNSAISNGSMTERFLLRVMCQMTLLRVL